MLLKSLELQGFKSFPDKTTLRFDKGITAVVGPNGSGKSNLSDAIRWVLGEQSTKSLRGAKMEDVIFNGTATRKAQGFAEVTICFDNTDRSLACDSDEVYVTRRYYRSGESEYKINRAVVRLRDINELFMDTGVGRDGYSMIGQGKISDVVSQRSEERRDMFEEAAGISRYRYRRQEAERKLSAAEENLVRLRDILSELEERVGPLREQSEKAQKFLEYSAERKELEIGLWLRTLERSKDLLREQEHKIDLVSSQYSALQETLAGMEQSMEQAAADAQRFTAQIDEVRRSAAGQEEEAARIGGDIAVAENTIFHNGENISRIRSELESFSGSGEALEQEKAHLRAQMNQKEEETTGLRRQLEEVSAALLKLLDESAGVSEQVEAFNREIADLAAQAAQSQVHAAAAQSSIAEIKTRSAVIEDTLRQQKEQQTVLESERSALEQDLLHCQEQISDGQNAAKGHEYLLSGRKEKAEQLKQKADTLALDAASAAKHAQMLEELEKNLEGFAYSVKAVMRESRNGTLHGVRGPVSRLFQVDAQYATAIEIALGAAMQNVVVETEQDAKRAIAFLKRQNAGRGTFLPLSSVRGRRLEEKNLDKWEGFIGLAVDLVQFEREYEGVMTSLLGRTAVAEDLDCAVSIAKQCSYRFRIVTLDGQVVNAGGSLTGGSLAKNAGLLGRTGEIERYRAKAKQLEEQAQQALHDYHSAAESLAAQEAALLAVRSEIATAQEDRIRVESELKRIRGQLNQLLDAHQMLERERQEAVQRLEALEEEATLAMAQEDQLRLQKQEKEQSLSEAMGGRDTLAHRREELNEQSAALQLAVMGSENEIESLRTAISGLEQRQEDAAGRKKELEEQIAGFELLNRQQEEQILQLKEKAAQLRQSAQQAEQQIEGLIEQRTQAEMLSQRLRVQEREQTAQRESLGGELARLEERRTAMNKEYDQVIAKLYDEYELTRSEAEALGIQIEDPQKAGRRLNELKNKIRALGSVNVGAVDEYAQVSERYEFLLGQVGDVEKAKAELLRLIQGLTSQMQEIFLEKFNLINSHFTHTFVELFGGGVAQLTLMDPSDVLESGIEIRVQPPGKNVSSIEQLSGGEKSLVAIAVYFAMMKVAPPAFCMLDEVESALDDVNVERFAGYLRRMSAKTQFIVVTHRRGSMEEADVLYGVTMQEKGVSKMLELNVNEVEQKLDLKG